jgi:hypothetical protein
MSYIYTDTPYIGRKNRIGSYVYGKDVIANAKPEYVDEFHPVKYIKAHSNSRALTSDEAFLRNALLSKAAEIEFLFAKVKVGSHHDRAVAAFTKAIRLIIEELEL